METNKSDSENNKIEPNVNKHTIFIPFDVIRIKCKNCGVEFAILGLTDKNDYMLQGNKNSKLYCPYCGKLAY